MKQLSKMMYVMYKLKSQAIRRMVNSCRQNTWLQHYLTVKIVRGAALRCASHKYHGKVFSNPFGETLNIETTGILKTTDERLDHLDDNLSTSSRAFTLAYIDLRLIEFDRLTCFDL